MQKIFKDKEIKIHTNRGSSLPHKTMHLKRFMSII